MLPQQPEQKRILTQPRARAGVSPFASGKAASKAASPFGDATEQRFTDSSEPVNMSPTMEADARDTAPWWTKITLTQVVLAGSFTTITLLMLATCVVVWNSGAISLNDN